MEETKFCLRCGKELLKRENQKRLNPRRNFCDKKCQTRYVSYKRYNVLKNNLEYKKKKREWEKNWYQNNKQRQKENTLKDYYRHKDRWRTRSRLRKIMKNKKKIVEIEKKCNICGSEENLTWRLTEYPQGTKNIRQAINDGKIFYLCKECRLKK